MTDRLIYKREEGLFKRRHDRSFRNDSRASRRRDFSYTQRFDTLQMRRHVVAVFIVFSSFPFFFFFFFVSSLFSCFLILTRHSLLIDYRLSLFMRVKLLAQKYRILHFLADSEVGSGSSGGGGGGGGFPSFSFSFSSWRVPFSFARLFCLLSRHVQLALQLSKFFYFPSSLFTRSTPSFGPFSLLFSIFTPLFLCR